MQLLGGKLSEPQCPHANWGNHWLTTRENELHRKTTENPSKNHRQTKDKPPKNHRKNPLEFGPVNFYTRHALCFLLLSLSPHLSVSLPLRQSIPLLCLSCKSQSGQFGHNNNGLMVGGGFGVTLFVRSGKLRGRKQKVSAAPAIVLTRFAPSHVLQPFDEHAANSP